MKTKKSKLEKQTKQLDIPVMFSKIKQICKKLEQWVMDFHPPVGG